MHGKVVEQRLQQLRNNVMRKFVFLLPHRLRYIVWRIEQTATIKTKLTTTTTTRRHKVENSKRSQMHLIEHNTERRRI